MLCQLVGFRPVERANVKFTKKCMLLIKNNIELLGNHQKVASYHIEASIADSET